MLVGKRYAELAGNELQELHGKKLVG